MKLVKIFLGVLSFLILSVSMLTAQVDFITAKDFKARLKAEEPFVLLDASKAKLYNENHIKGAIHIDHNALYQEGDIAGLILAPEDLAKIFGNLGINEKTEVIVYDDGTNKYSNRVYWILKYLGAENVKILHKDMNEWGMVRLPLSTEPVVAAEAVTFTPTLNEDFFASLDFVKENKDKEGFVLVDVRTADEFNGVKNSEGHIEGAVNMNFEILLNENGSFKTAEELKTIAEEYGITPDKEAIFYCKTSVRATVAFVAFRNILGYEKVRVFDGAYNEWAANYPVAQ